MSDEEELPSKDIWLKNEGGFPAPDWNFLIDWQEKKSEQTKKRLAVSVIDDWVDALCEHGGKGFEVISSKHFLVVSGRLPREGDLLVTSMERAVDRIAKHLPGIARVRSVPKYVAILFGDHDTFLEYVSIFYPEEGEFGHPGGMFIPDGLGHFILPGDPIASIESSITHELTHVLCGHLHLPSWIDEGLAQAMECAALLGRPRIFDREHIDEHRAYWTEERLADFWTGTSFKSIDGQRLSYSLAEFLLNALPGDQEQVVKFVTHASAEDGGHAAAREILGVELEALIVPLVPTLADRFGASGEDPPE
jgi:hypothetical protein